ncbi:hypothetical protein PVAR5_4926 [Paecilomyces variotii No. 5]|uniref:Uncharacterized protein n=1 Tax=Byssochlamys spectabilis (strain No. 5 / NBRC 109023) TaxID=1356009 RepID=V5G2P7_BYSSN|nr:hypothetical protein PVAR5_4926 [Paecilomyces variotii No. 5]
MNNLHVDALCFSFVLDFRARSRQRLGHSESVWQIGSRGPVRGTDEILRLLMGWRLPSPLSQGRYDRWRRRGALWDKLQVRFETGIGSEVRKVLLELRMSICKSLPLRASFRNSPYLRGSGHIWQQQIALLLDIQVW